MKKSYLLVTILALSFIYSCTSDSEEINDEMNNIENVQEISNKNSDSNSRKAFLNCGIDSPDAACSEQIVTFTYSTNPNISSIYWKATAGNLTLISGQGTTTATFLTGSPFCGGFVQAYGSGSPDCIASKQILKCGSEGECGSGGDGNGSCACPNPVIDDRLCVSGGHPHWRFQVDGISSSDQITWSINHGTIHSNPNQSYVIIEPNSGSIAGFTVYCRVERTCSDGSKKVRTAYYTNYYGNSCGTGTTGFVGGCSGGSMIDDIE